MTKFEDLLDGKDITELSEEQIKDIISKLSLKETERFEKSVRESKKKTPNKRQNAAKQKKDSEFEKILNEGLKK